MRSIDVSRWQAHQSRWKYDPTLWFYWRFAMCTLADAMKSRCGVPTDDALLARAWIASSAGGEVVDGKRPYLSFDECCHWLGLDADAERLACLEMIDAASEFDTDECWERLEALSQDCDQESGEHYEVPVWARVVPALDQMDLLGITS